jgi:flagellar L-ring protein precursor FlgH
MMRFRVPISALIFLLGVTVLPGCVTTPSQNKDLQAHSTDARGYDFETLNASVPSEGSLWADGSSRGLFADMRAMQIGDLVTIRISEKPKGSLSAKTQTKRDSSIDAGITNFLGIMETYGKNHSLDPEHLFKANIGNEFKGDGSNSRDGELDAYITARVIQVLSNGNLRILGRQEIKVNTETQHITVSGIVRPEDINTNNEVQSTYIADARIEYSGQGSIADKQKPGWLSRIIDNVWPF